MAIDFKPDAPIDFQPEVQTHQAPPPPSLLNALYTATNPVLGIGSASGALKELSDYLTGKRKAGEQAMVTAAAKGKPALSSHTFALGSAADTAKILSGLLQPSTIAQLIAAGVIPEVMLPYFALTGTKSALTLRQPGESTAEALQRRLLAASQVTGSVAGGLSKPLQETAAAHMETAGELPGKLAKLPKGALRSVTGAGENAIRQYEEQYAPKLEEARKRYAAKELEAEQAKAAHDAQESARLETARKKYNESVQENLDKARQAHAEGNRKLRDEYIAKSREAAKAREVVDRRAALENAKDRVARQVVDDTKDLHRSVRARLDARWNALRQKVGVNTPVDMAPVSAAVDKAITDDLRGEPQNVALFNRVLQESPEEELPQGAEETIAKANRLISMGMKPDAIVSALREQYPKGQVARIAPLLGTVPGEAAPEMTFDGARIRYSALGDRMSSESIPGNVYRALSRVRKALGSVIEKTADEKGAGPEYRKLLADWRDYSFDWRGYKPGESGRTAVLMGGSPLYRLLKAEDPKTALSILTGAAKERLIQQLQRYGGKASVGRFAALAGRIDSELKNLPKPPATAVREPARPELKSFKPAAERPFEPPAPRPFTKGLKPFEPPRKLTPEEIRKASIQRTVDRLSNRKLYEVPFALLELLRGNFIEPAVIISALEGFVRLLSNPRVRDFIAKD